VIREVVVRAVDPLSTKRLVRTSK